jgi:recombinational DNA repair protein RecT
MAVDLAQLQQVLDNAQKADALKADVKRALRKVSSLVVNLQSAVEEAEALMSDDYTPAVKERKPRVPREAVEVDAEAPYGRKKDGTPKSKPGRSKE